MKTVKKIASVALPILGTVVGGPIGGALGGAAGGALSGGGLKGALIGGGLGALGGGLSGVAPTTGIGILDSLNSSIVSGLSPISQGIGSILSPIQKAFGSAQSALGIPDFGIPQIGGLDALRGAASSGSAPVSALDSALGNAAGGSGYSAAEQGLLNSAGAASGGVSGNSGSFLSDMISKIKDNPFGAANTAITLAQALGGNEVAGTQSQEQILAQMQADKAKQQQFSEETLRMLNSASSGRAPITPSISDYYTYGTRPEATFFDRVNTPITY